MVQRYVLFLVVFIFSLNAAANDFEAVEQLAQRRVPWLSRHLVLKKVPGAHTQDVFELSSENGRVVIRANNANSAAMGVNWYLKYYCRRSMSHTGTNLAPVYPLPVIENKVRVTSPFKYRYALNYCTLNYTMSFYSWADWERELDWMALNGVNLMLATTGTEAVWQHTLKKFGFSDPEIKAFIPGPGFTAWWLMGNLEGWGGPVTQPMIDQRTALQKQILVRMRELDMEPVLQGFYGMVPRALKKHFPDAAIREQGKWAGNFDRPDFLLPEDPLFKQMAEAYYTEIKKLYGTKLRFFGGDPFHEGGSTQGVDLAQAGHIIQSCMQQAYPNSSWLLQGWQENPRPELLQGLDKSSVLVLQLGGEKANDWEKTKGFNGTPFIWNTVNNFGEKSGLYGKLQYFSDEISRIRNSRYASLCKGIGVMPEGIHNNPVVYDWMLSLAWLDQKAQVKDWIPHYIQSRYGLSNDTLRQAWQILLKNGLPKFSQPGGWFARSHILCPAGLGYRARVFPGEAANGTMIRLCSGMG
ncbi:alpha-N-acetylglucosaminidase [Niabella sp. CC-SYL272]|uniref:alpha-N-acetylglucosaminidase n=1 Tax=Niabella agricola TaxID=2891571 RepID=UPI001F2331DD|nr:alpha-N-acetylglucosaminidase [Niabella agricola]MCF3108671.1 alpha-N-acetylglucosaminidase [Niabella agricola]